MIGENIPMLGTVRQYHFGTHITLVLERSIECGMTRHQIIYSDKPNSA